MNAQEIITKFQSLGYELHLSGDTIRYKHTGGNIPPKDEVLPLLDFLKQNKQAAIAFLREADVPVDYEKLFTDTVRHIQKNYQAGAIPFAEGCMPGMMGKVNEAEGRINLFWGLNVQEFQAALKEWEQILSEISAVFHDAQKRLCVLCGSQGERVVFGEDKSGKYSDYWYCLKCKPYKKDEKQIQIF